MNLLTSFIFVIRREWLLTWRRPIEWINTLLFFVLVTMLLPLSLPPNVKILQMLGPSVMWVAALLALLFSLNRLFQQDYEDGSLEQWFFSACPLSLLIFAKMVAQWLLLIIPLIIFIPLLAIMFQLSGYVTIVLLLTLLLGTALLILLGGMGAALTVGVSNQSLLVALILLPLYIPVLIFATSAVNAAINGQPIAGSLAWLGALLILATAISPVITASCLRMSVAFK